MMDVKDVRLLNIDNVNLQYSRAVSPAVCEGTQYIH